MVGKSYDIRTLQQSTPQRSLAADYSHPQAFSKRNLENNFPDNTSGTMYGVLRFIVKESDARTATL